MATNIGQPSGFDPQAESMVAYMERLFYRANVIKAASQVQLVIQVVCKIYTCLH